MTNDDRRWRNKVFSTGTSLLLLAFVVAPFATYAKDSKVELRVDIDQNAADISSNTSEIQINIDSIAELQDAVCAHYEVTGDVPPVFCSKVVFITSQRFNGNLGGVAGADSKCQTAANDAGLVGTFKAWISTAGSDTAPADRFVQIPGIYERVDGTKVADGWGDLTDGSLDAPINVDELGTQLPGPTNRAWSNVAPNGQRHSTVNTCQSWTTTESSGNFGLAQETNSQWTVAGGLACDLSFRLYCFQQ